MKKRIIKNKIMKLLKKDPNKEYDRIDIADNLYKTIFGQVVYYTWNEVEEGLDELIKEGKIERKFNEYNFSIFTLSRRYNHDRFLYKG